MQTNYVVSVDDGGALSADDIRNALLATVEPIERLYGLEVTPLPAPLRYALVHEQAGMTDQIASYLPGNYWVIGRTAIRGTNRVQILIGGSDVAGWTLDEYVIPRLASGMIIAEEIGA